MPAKKDEEGLLVATFERAVDIILNEMDKLPNPAPGEEPSDEAYEQLTNHMEDMCAILEGTMTIEGFKIKNPTYDDEILN